MKLRREGVIRLEQFSELAVKRILDFIYTGYIDVSLTNPEGLVEAADYLRLSDIQRVLLNSPECGQKPSNSISTLDLAKRNHFKKLMDATSVFIHSNFAAVAASETFLNFTVRKIKMWIRQYGLFNLKEHEVRTSIELDERKWIEEHEKVFQTVIATCGENGAFCYLPKKEQWYILASSKYNFKDRRQLLSLNGCLYNFTLTIFGSSFQRWSPRSNQWVSLPLPSKVIPEMVVLLGDVIYGIGSRSGGQQKYVCKYNLDSNSWEAIPSSEARVNIGSCTVGHQTCLYFIGGMPNFTRASRFDTTKNKWENISDLQHGRYNAFGAACHERIYVAGGKQHDNCYLQTCEVYSIATNDWQFIANLNVPRSEASMVCHLGTLYVLGGLSEDKTARAPIVECYDEKADKWEERTAIPSHMTTGPDFCEFQACLLTIHEEYLDSFPQVE